MCKTKQNLCLDKGYDFEEIKDGVIKKGYLPHIRHRGEQFITKGGNHHSYRKRWVVERTNSWHNRFRKLLIRYKKKLENYFALVCLGCCIIIYRKIILGYPCEFPLNVSHQLFHLLSHIHMCISIRRMIWIITHSRPDLITVFIHLLRDATVRLTRLLFSDLKGVVTVS